MWEAVVGGLELVVFLAGQTLGGSLSLGIFTVAAAVRLLLLPLTYRVARRADARRRQLEALKPEIARLKKTWKGDPVRLAEEIRAAQAKHGIALVDPSQFGVALLQIPLVLGLFHAVRNVIAGSALAAFSLPVAGVAGCLAAVSVWSNAPSHSLGTAALATVAAVTAAVMVVTLGAGFGYYSSAFQGVSTLQGLLLRRHRRRTEAGQSV